VIDEKRSLDAGLHEAVIRDMRKHVENAPESCPICNATGVSEDV
jgi:hypothetical protein